MTLLFTALQQRCTKCGSLAPCPDAPVPCDCGWAAQSRLDFQYQVADELGIAEANLSKWKKRSDAFIELAKDRPNLLKAHPGSKSPYKDIEWSVYEAFIYRRKVQGLPADGYWIRRSEASF